MEIVTISHTIAAALQEKRRLNQNRLERTTARVYTLIVYTIYASQYESVHRD